MVHDRIYRFGTPCCSSAFSELFHDILYTINRGICATVISVFTSCDRVHVGSSGPVTYTGFSANNESPEVLTLRGLVFIIFFKLRHISAAFLMFFYAFREQIFDLSVDGTEIGLCPSCEILVQLGRKSERNLFFLIFVH